MESANVNFDEYKEVHDDESMKKIEEYKSFVFFYEGMPSKEDVTDQFGNQQKVSVIAESHSMNVKFYSITELHLKIELHSRTILHSDADPKNEVYIHSDSKVSVHERDAKIPKCTQ